jgi:hypothetical protein
MAQHGPKIVQDGSRWTQDSPRWFPCQSAGPYLPWATRLWGIFHSIKAPLSTYPYIHISIKPQSEIHLLSHPSTPRAQKPYSKPPGTRVLLFFRPTGTLNPRGKTHTLWPGPPNPHSKTTLYGPDHPIRMDFPTLSCPDHPNLAKDAPKIAPT